MAKARKAKAVKPKTLKEARTMTKPKTKKKK